MNAYVRGLAMAAALECAPHGVASADTCACDGPCSGSITCPGGCYAYCEDNPENSGRHVFVKGCASSDAGNKAGAVFGVIMASGAQCGSNGTALTE